MHDSALTATTHRRDGARTSMRARPMPALPFIYGFARLWFILLLGAMPAAAGTVSLAWDPSSDPQVAGYQVYYGSASRDYSVSVDVGQATTAAFSDLQGEQVYYFAVTAYDSSGLESAFSNEVAYDLSTVDSDQDGLSDWNELNLYGTDPDRTDTDGDGLSDGEEVKTYQTDPTQADTDGDGLSDGVEVRQGSDPVGDQPSPAPHSPTVAVRAGGPQYTAANGTVYQADNGFTGGKSWMSTEAITGTKDPALYQGERFGNFSYTWALANGDYLVTLRFAEIYWSGAGQRVFDVAIEGVVVIDQLDLVAKVGARKAYDVVVPVQVTDGVLTMEFRSVVDYAKVSAIDITPDTQNTQQWANYAVTLKLWSQDNDAMGVMFRYQDGDNYYRFSWDQERSSRRLVKRDNGVFTLLAEDSVPYVKGQVYQVKIVADGATLEVWIDGERIFSVADASFHEGSIALYTWWNWGDFDDIVVTDLDTGAVVLAADFTNGSLADWTVVDDGQLLGPSAWSVVDGAVHQASNVYSKPTNRADLTRLGTYLLYSGPAAGF
jgi:Malectin domain/Bacterial TSP3 repeat